MIKITPTVSISEKNIEQRFIHASGPGGQNVNKVATAVQLRFDMNTSALPQYIRDKLIVLAGKKLTNNGVLIIEAKRFRTQLRNREDAMTRLINLLQKAAKIQKPRKKTKPTLGAKKRRLESKQQRGKVKQTRAKNFSVTD